MLKRLQYKTTKLTLKLKFKSGKCLDYLNVKTTKLTLKLKSKYGKHLKTSI